MMNCCQCQGIEEMFSAAYVASELSRYRKKGPEKTTRMLIEALKKQGVRGLTLLDIGGGLGAIQHEMLAAGVQKATSVDASAAYLDASQAEAQRRGYGGQITYQHGNFAEMAESLQPADIVTLDRVICCYHDMEKLVDLSSARAGRFYGVVYPRSSWWMKTVLAIQNFFFRLRGSPFRIFIHPPEAVEALIHRNGLKRRYYRQTLIWQVVLYTR